jgi:prepilin-type N-terminal cleavage/methylation domain-containing protein
MARTGRRVLGSAPFSPTITISQGGTIVLQHIKSSEDWSEKSLGAKGFTLVELLVVVVILGILAAVVVFSVQGFSEDAQAEACQTELRTIRTAAEIYYTTNENTWPTGVAQLQAADLLSSDAEGTYDFAGNAVAQTACP